MSTQRIEEIRQDLEAKDVLAYPVQGKRGMELEDGVLISEEQCDEILALLTRQEEAERVMEDAAKVADKISADWGRYRVRHDGWEPMDTLMEELFNVLLSGRWLEGE